MQLAELDNFRMRAFAIFAFSCFHAVQSSVLSYSMLILSSFGFMLTFHASSVANKISRSVQDHYEISMGSLRFSSLAAHSLQAEYIVLLIKCDTVTL